MTRVRFELTSSCLKGRYPSSRRTGQTSGDDENRTRTSSVTGKYAETTTTRHQRSTSNEKSWTQIGIFIPA